MYGIVIVLQALLWTGNSLPKASDVSATDPPPHCFKESEHSFVRTPPFQKKIYESPNECADTCLKIHNDQEEVRTCRAFDYNVRTGMCRFYEKNTQDENIHLGEITKLNVYELDEGCLTKHQATPPHHISACKQGSKPLMERVSGADLRASGLAFKQVQEKQCVQDCLKDQTPSRHENIKCQSVSYNDEMKTCSFLNQIARPLNKRGPPLTPDPRYRYYSKLCLPIDAVAKCPGYITRFVGKQLVAMSDAKTTTSSYGECVRACLTADTTLGFECRSGMFYSKQSSDNCILNYSDHYDEHTLFVDEDNDDIDYFSVRSCQW